MSTLLRKAWVAMGLRRRIDDTKLAASSDCLHPRAARLRISVKYHNDGRAANHAQPLGDLDCVGVRGAHDDGASQSRDADCLADTLEQCSVYASQARTSFRPARSARRLVSLVSRHGRKNLQ